MLDLLNTQGAIKKSNFVKATFPAGCMITASAEETVSDLRDF
jgi:hypothetical protein